MIVGRGEIRVGEPRCGGRGVNMIAGTALVESNDEKGVGPVRAGGDQRHERLKKSVTLSGCPVVHVVGHIRDHEGKVDGRIEIRERLYISALHRIEPDTLKPNGRIVFPHILPGQTGTVDATNE
jgi:hypothetical protein